MKRTFTESQEHLIVTLYQTGQTPAEIAASHNISAAHVRAILRRHGALTPSGRTQKNAAATKPEPPAKPQQDWSAYSWKLSRNERALKQHGGKR